VVKIPDNHAALWSASFPGYQFVFGCAMNSRGPKDFFVYMTASKPRGVIYTGMTSDLAGRSWEHRKWVVDGFTKKFWVGRLVYFEHHDLVEVAQRREYLMKRWRRDWKIELIEKANPTWRDLFADAVGLEGHEW
jgi:putative endonuclease